MHRITLAVTIIATALGGCSRDRQTAKDDRQTASDDRRPADTSNTPRWEPLPCGVTANLRGLCPVSESVCWASGAGGTVLRTTDGGRTWQRRDVPASESLDFRDIHAFDANTAIAMNAGEPAYIYKTADGGTTWAQRYVNTTKGVFLDGMAFWDRNHGLAFGDPMDGRVLILTTGDGGNTWTPVAPESIPKAVPGETGFAASGTSVCTFGAEHAWIGLGGPVARVLRTSDRGKTWRFAGTPLACGNDSSGVFSVCFRDASYGIVVGGDHRMAGNATKNGALTPDGGATWSLLTLSPPSGYRSCVTIRPDTSPGTLVAVGPNGCDWSTDGGMKWTRFADTGYNTAAFAPDGKTTWAVGADGRVAKMRWKGE